MNKVYRREVRRDRSKSPCCMDTEYSIDGGVTWITPKAYFAWVDTVIVVEDYYKSFK